MFRCDVNKIVNVMAQAYIVNSFIVFEASVKKLIIGQTLVIIEERVFLIYMLILLKTRCKKTYSQQPNYLEPCLR